MESNVDLHDKPSHIRVVVRVRPLNSKECASGSGNVVNPMDEHMLVFDPKIEEEQEHYQGKVRRNRDLLRKRNKDQKFAFDRVFDRHASTVHVYEDTTKKILDGLLDGINCSVFAYGATGAGKTHTMLGSLVEPGVMFLTMKDLYDRIDNIKEIKTCEVAVSYLEVYNEQIRDLLDVTKDYLPIRENNEKGVVVAGLSQHRPPSAEALLAMLDKGNRNRTQHPTDANAESSRSHAVFQVFVRQRDRTGSTSTDVRLAKMSLIDLAGSERATVSTNQGARMREGANINRSLLALGNCINALADGKNNVHVPYRNSKLTRLLKDSLGGNCRTVMIAAVSPSSLSYEDTFNTLKYANRAKNIRASIKRNVVSVDYHITRYVQIIDDLRTEVLELKNKLDAEKKIGSAVVSHICSNPVKDDSTIIATKVIEKNIVASLKPETEAAIQNLNETYRSTRLEFLKLEGVERDLFRKIHRKQRLRFRIESHVDLIRRNPLIERALRSENGLVSRLSSVRIRKNAVIDRLSALLTTKKSHIDEIKAREHSPLLDARLQMDDLSSKLADSTWMIEYMKKICKTQSQELDSAERLNSQLLEVITAQFRLLRNSNLVTVDVSESYDGIIKSLSDDVFVIWADKLMKEPVCFDIDRILSMPSSELSKDDHLPVKNETSDGKPAHSQLDKAVGIIVKDIEGTKTMKPNISSSGKSLLNEEVLRDGLKEQCLDKKFQSMSSSIEKQPPKTKMMARRVRITPTPVKRSASKLQSYCEPSYGSHKLRRTQSCASLKLCNSSSKLLMEHKSFATNNQMESSNHQTKRCVNFEPSSSPYLYAKKSTCQEINENSAPPNDSPLLSCDSMLQMLEATPCSPSVGKLKLSTVPRSPLSDVANHFKVKNGKLSRRQASFVIPSSSSSDRDSSRREMFLAPDQSCQAVSLERRLTMGSNSCGKKLVRQSTVGSSLGKRRSMLKQQQTASLKRSNSVASVVMQRGSVPNYMQLTKSASSKRQLNSTFAIANTSLNDSQPENDMTVPRKKNIFQKFSQSKNLFNRF